MTDDNKTSKDNIPNLLDEIDWDFSGYNPSNRINNIHQLHWYPAPFPSALPGTLIDILGCKSQKFLDPFSGTGTAPFEAWFRGKEAIGIDSNSFAVDIAKAKTKLLLYGTLNISENLKNSYSAYRKINKRDYSDIEPEFVCDKAGLDKECMKWFTKNNLAEIAIIKKWIFDSSSLVSDWQDVLMVILSSMLHKYFSVARKYHYTYVVDNSRLEVPEVVDVDVAQLFANKIESDFLTSQLTRENNNLNLNCHPIFIKGCAQNVENLIIPEIDLVITSPPYFGMNDYVRSQYLSWLVFQWDSYKGDIQIESGSRRNRDSMKKLEEYLNVMEVTFSGLYKVMKKGSFLALVLGDSNTKIARLANPLSKLREMVLKQGFDSIWLGNRRVKFRKVNYISYRSESIWVFRR